MAIKCSRCSTFVPPGAEACPKCELTGWGMVWYSLTFIPRKLLNIQETEDGQLFIKCPNCGVSVSIKAERCGLCNQDLSTLGIAKLLLNQTKLSLSRINMYREDAANYAAGAFGTMMATLFFIPYVVLNFASAGMIAGALGLSAVVTAVEVTLIHWTVRGRANMALKRSFPGAKLGHFFLGITLLLMQWAAIAFYPLPAMAFLGVILGLWIASVLFLRFILPHATAHGQILDDAEPNRPRPYDPESPQGRQATED